MTQGSEAAKLQATQKGPQKHLWTSMNLREVIKKDIY